MQKSILITSGQQGVPFLVWKCKPSWAILDFESWFAKSKGVFGNLLNTYHGDVDKKWRSHILSWDRWVFLYSAGKMRVMSFYISFKNSLEVHKKPTAAY